jgi:hypothetical protein
MTADTVPTDGHIATGATAPHPDNARYGRHVWMCARDGAWRMDGIYGQFGIVLPNHRACVTVTATLPRPDHRHSGRHLGRDRACARLARNRCASRRRTHSAGRSDRVPGCYGGGQVPGVVCDLCQTAPVGSIAKACVRRSMSRAKSSCRSPTLGDPNGWSGPH